MGTIDDRGDAADRAPVASGYEGCDLPVPDMEGRLRGKIFGNATRKRRDEGRIRSVQALRHPLELLPLRRRPANGNRTHFFFRQD